MLSKTHTVSLRPPPSGTRLRPRTGLSIIHAPAVAAVIAVFTIATAAYAEALPDPNRRHQLRDLVLHNCSACHGPALEGKVGPALTPIALSDKDTAQLTHTILNGRSGTPMPAWSFMVNENEAKWIIEQLKRGTIRGD